MPAKSGSSFAEHCCLLYLCRIANSFFRFHGGLSLPTIHLLPLEPPTRTKTLDNNICPEDVIESDASASADITSSSSSYCLSSSSGMLLDSSNQRLLNDNMFL